VKKGTTFAVSSTNQEVVQKSIENWWKKGTAIAVSSTNQEVVKNV
jgi:hypothetical protein